MSVSPSSFSKQPSEIFTIQIDFTKRLSSDETIATRTVTALDETTDVSATVLSGDGVSSDGKSVLIGVKAGTTAHSYKITAKITTNKVTPGSTGYAHEADVTMRVLEE
jgi:hypothetical protein